MQIDLRYKEGLPYGLREVFRNRVGTLMNSIFMYSLYPGLVVSALIGGYIARDDDPARGAAGGALVCLVGNLIAVVLYESYFGSKYEERLKQRHAAFIEHYSEHLSSFLRNETLPEDLDTLLEDGLRIDALPHYVTHFDVGMLERTLAGISDNYRLIPGLFSADREDTPRLLGYQYLADILSTSDVKPEAYVSLFSPDRLQYDTWPMWVGGNRLVRLYHETKRYDDEAAFRKLSRFQYNYCGPVPNS